MMCVGKLPINDAPPPPAVLKSRRDSVAAKMWPVIDKELQLTYAFLAISFLDFMRLIWSLATLLWSMTARNRSYATVALTNLIYMCTLHEFFSWSKPFIFILCCDQVRKRCVQLLCRRHSDSTTTTSPNVDEATAQNTQLNSGPGPIQEQDEDVTSDAAVSVIDQLPQQTNNRRLPSTIIDAAWLADRSVVRRQVLNDHQQIDKVDENVVDSGNESDVDGCQRGQYDTQMSKSSTVITDETAIGGDEESSPSSP